MSIYRILPLSDTQNGQHLLIWTQCFIQYDPKSHQDRHLRAICSVQWQVLPPLVAIKNIVGFKHRPRSYLWLQLMGSLHPPHWPLHAPPITSSHAHIHFCRPLRHSYPLQYSPEWWGVATQTKLRHQRWCRRSASQTQGQRNFRDFSTKRHLFKLL